MAKYDKEDPWAWAHEDLNEIPKPLSGKINELVPIDRSVPSNITGAGPGPLTMMAYTKGAEKAGTSAYEGAKGAYESWLASQPSNVGTTAPVQSPATGSEAMQIKPLGPLSEAPANSSVVTPLSPEAVGLENTVATNAAPLATEAAANTATTAATASLTPELAAAAEASGLTTAGMTAAEIEMLLAQQAAASAAASTAPEWLAALVAAA